MSFVLYEYECARCGRFESLERRPAPTVMTHECGKRAVRVISAVKSRTVWGAAASRGKSDPPPPGAIDTRPLADGMSPAEWRAQRRKHHAEQRRQNVRQTI